MQDKKSWNHFFLAGDVARVAAAPKRHRPWHARLVLTEMHQL